MTTTSGEQIRPYHAEAAVIYPILPPACVIDEDTQPGDGVGQSHMNGLQGGAPRYSAQVGFTVLRHRGLHEAGHAFFALLYYWIPVAPTTDWHERSWSYLGYANTYAQQLADANAEANPVARWNKLPEERLVEAFASSIDGVAIPGDPTPADLRQFFLSMMYEARPSLTPPAPPPPDEGAKPVTIVVDYMNRHNLDWMIRLRRDYGATGIARYLTNRPGDPKCFSAAERDDAKAAGLEVHLVWETTGGSVAFNPGGASYFTPAMGMYDCDQTIQRLDELGAPMGIVVYFAVDVNLDPALTDAYFTAVERRAGTRFKVGAYGYERLCNFARDNWVNVGQRLWQTYGTPRGPLDLWQHLQDDYLGVQMDVNDAIVQGWVLGDDDMMSQDQFNIWFDQRFAETPEYKNTVDAIKGVLGDLAETTRKLAANEVVDDAEVAALKARVDKLRTI